MRIQGRLTKWNDDRGFGFITPNQGGPEIFVHVSAFPKDGQRPVVGENLTFEVEIPRDGKQKAKNLVCLDRQNMPSHHRKMRAILERIATLLVLLALGVYGYHAYSRQTGSELATVFTTANDHSESAPPASFRCDGRTHCSQMTSCAEATYFLENCPNVKMDGENDGVPCEKQWCNSPFAR